ncbi:MAG: hypothetical protein P1U81_16250 [Verrucomicrobiales bacterium]|nr:hypothetical protein [Verrucomicrobiales bacterium]
MKSTITTIDSTGLGRRLNRVGSFLLTLSLLSLFATPVFSQEEGKKRGGKPDSKDADTWSAEEYSGLRGEKDLQAALASKGFAWISGSPADNEKLSVGKNAQFFGFVALRYQSGRAANRGMLGRAMFAIADEAQRARMAEAVNAEKAALQEWWVVREEILTLLEDHLYTGQPINREELAPLGERFSVLNSMVATHEAAAFAAFEDSMTSAQGDIMAGWRADAESAGDYGRDVRVEAENVDREDQKQLEDLYAKAFSWLTGKPEDNEIIPIGQPAQFFGFVSIRHKSGHAASRGTIAKDFFAMLNDEQQGFIEHAVEVQIPVVREFLENRHEFLNQLASLRTDPSAFDGERVHHLSAEMGRLEMDAAVIEAEAYRNIRASMSEDQVAALMKMRGEYVIDEAQVAAMDMKQRGATLAILCSGCHGAPGQHRVGFPAPSLDGFWDRKIASGPNFEYSAALTNVRRGGNETWTPELLDQFLANPKKFAPGTKMEFQGLLNEEDRKALIEHLKTSRQ